MRLTDWPVWFKSFQFEGSSWHARNKGMSIFRFPHNQLGQRVQWVKNWLWCFYSFVLQVQTKDFSLGRGIMTDSRLDNSWASQAQKRASNEWQDAEAQQHISWMEALSVCPLLIKPSTMYSFATPPQADHWTRRQIAVYKKQKQVQPYTWK